jgi:hypothetical protein
MYSARPHFARTLAFLHEYSFGSGSPACLQERYLWHAPRITIFIIFARSSVNRLQTTVVQRILFAYQQPRNAVPVHSEVEPCRLLSPEGCGVATARNWAKEQSRGNVGTEWIIQSAPRAYGVDHTECATWLMIGSYRVRHVRTEWIIQDAPRGYGVAHIGCATCVRSGSYWVRHVANERIRQGAPRGYGADHTGCATWLMIGSYRVRHVANDRIIQGAPRGYAVGHTGCATWLQSGSYRMRHVVTEWLIQDAPRGHGVDHTGAPEFGFSYRPGMFQELLVEWGIT